MGAGQDLWARTERLINDHDFEAAVEAMYVEDAVLVTSGSRYEGAKAIQEFMVDFTKAFPDGKVTTSHVVEEGDSLVVEYTFEGTHTGPLSMPDGSEIPPTGKSVRGPLVSVFDLANGKVTEERMYADNALLMEQLGLTATS
jgi:predicted ester cyclase